MRTKSKRIVVIGGGTGIFALLSGLKNSPHHVTAIVTMADDGGSTGLLRDDFGILPPGDVRRAIVALAKTPNPALPALFNYRFEEGAGLAGHNIGNLMLTALERMTGSFEAAVEHMCAIMHVEGSVIPVTLTLTKLCAQLENGTIVEGETNIDIPKHDGRLRIEKLWLKPEAVMNPKAKAAILAADAVVIGPGDLYTSLLPNILVKGVPQAIAKTRGRVIYICNLMTKFGETNGFTAGDFLNTIERYLGTGVVDSVITNSKKPTPSRLKPYIAEKAELIEVDRAQFTARPMLVTADIVRSRGLVRHDPEKTARVILSLI